MFTKLKILPVMALGIFCIGMIEGNAKTTGGSCTGTNWNPSWNNSDCQKADKACQDEVNTQLKNCKEKDKNKCKITADVCKPFMMKLPANSSCQNWTGYWSCLGEIPLVYPLVAAKMACHQQGYSICSDSLGVTQRKKSQLRSKH